MSEGPEQSQSQSQSEKVQNRKVQKGPTLKEVLELFCRGGDLVFNGFDL